MGVVRVSRSWGLLGFAVVIAVVAFWLTQNYLTTKEDSLRQELLEQQGEYVSVVVATQPLAPGDVIGPENMAVADVPAEFLSASAVRPDDFGIFQNQVVRQFMAPGEPLLNHFVAGIGIERFSDLLDNGERAVTLEIDSINSVAGMILPGDFVDIMLVIDEESAITAGAIEKEDKNLKPLLQGVRILSVDNVSLVSKEQDFIARNGDGDDSLQYSNVTVGVNFEDATKLVLARDIGDLVFMLRNQKDTALLSADLLTREDLMKSGGATSNSYQYFSGSQNIAGSLSATTKPVSKLANSQSQRFIKSRPINKDKTAKDKSNLISSK